MSALSRIPGLAPLVGAVASAFSLRANPTLRRYNDALAQRFYHHGRLCASNQATVMVLVILFVGMISYPGIVTSYNSSAYVRQRSSIQSVSLSFSPQLPSVSGVKGDLDAGTPRSSRPTSRHMAGQISDLDTFWLNKIMAPTWSQDPDVFDGRLPSKNPLVFIAPLIINASSLFSNGPAAGVSLGDNNTFAGLNLFEYASRIQERIQSIEVELNSNPDSGVSGTNRALSQVVTFKDICLQQPSGSSAEAAEHLESKSRTTAGNCIVHSPVSQKGHDSKGEIYSRIVDTVGADDHRDTLQDSHPNLFAGSVPGDEQNPTMPKSLVMTFFLRGDLVHTKSKEKATSSFEDLDVRRIWVQIIDRLKSDLAEEMSGTLNRPLEQEGDMDQMTIQAGSVRTFDVGNFSSPSPLLDRQEADFRARIIPGLEDGGSKRIVSEVKYALPITALLS